ncbi:MAG: hypothetical protein GY822_20850 [Deltaproteobacteria bacterium]|nr:hypothetical protein [Deltaproteobacteria bacterium]
MMNSFASVAALVDGPAVRIQSGQIQCEQKCRRRILCDDDTEANQARLLRR